ncbi:hypothetical protein PG989_015643 [Apiospora arundinis]
MGSNKKRLYVALYPSGVVNNEERRYHWGFLIGPEEEKEKNVRSTATLLVRVVIAKITDERRLIQLLRQVPVVQDDPEWRCRTWVAQALRAIERDGHCVSSAVLDWPIIEAKAREYAAAKAAAGRYGLGKDMLAPKPTYNILERRETVP